MARTADNFAGVDIVVVTISAEDEFLSVRSCENQSITVSSILDARIKATTVIIQEYDVPEFCRCLLVVDGKEEENFLGRIEKDCSFGGDFIVLIEKAAVFYRKITLGNVAKL